jgi:hypothetical protein
MLTQGRSDRACVPVPGREAIMATIMANGLNIAYESHGNPDDPCVLLVMGLGMQLIAWPADFVEGIVEQGFRSCASTTATAACRARWRWRASRICRWPT